MSPWFAQLVRVHQILIVALLLAVFGLALAGLLLGPLTPPPPPVAGTGAAGPFTGIHPLRLQTGGYIIAQIPLLFILSAVFRTRAVSIAAAHADEPARRDRKLATQWTICIIVRAALAEGAGFLGGITLLLVADQLALIGVGYAAIVLLALMPTRGKLESWIHRAVQHAALAPSREPVPR